MTLRDLLRPTTLALTMAFALPVSFALAAPPFWGATYAYMQGPDDPASFTSARPVHVAARLPGNFACMDLVDARLNDPGPPRRVLDMLRAAPVLVTIEPSVCPADGKDRWLRFVVQHPIQADILELVYVTPAGKRLGSEKVHISSGSGGPYGD